MQTTAQAQQRDTSRTRADTLRGRTDTLSAARDTAAKRDTTADLRVPIPPGADSLLQRDSLQRRDAARQAVPVVARDTIMDPLASAEAPVLADPQGSLIWDRNDIFSTGALTVQDLLDRVPGITGFRSSWIAQPMVSSFLGDPGRVRVFLDGLELTELDPRMRGMWDLSQLPLWALDDIRIERSPGEIRIHMRSWRVVRTTPFTRTDIYTGDQATNLYRGLFGRRYRHGEVLQAAGQQFGTTPGRNAESSDQLGAMGRAGWAAGGWSADVFFLRMDRNRGLVLAEPGTDSVTGTESTRTDAYVRLGWGSTEGDGPWVQALANATRYAFGGQSTGTGPTSTSTVDTARFRSQYVLSAGDGRGPWRASVTQRLVVGANRSVATPALRASFNKSWLTVSAFGEGRSLDSTRRADVSAVLRPLSWIYLAGAAGTERHLLLGDSTEAPLFTRAEAGVRLRDVWFSGGIMRRGVAALDAPVIFRAETPAVVDSGALGYFAGIRGRLWKALYADIQGIRWSDTAAYYRPRYQARSELYVSTSLLDRFPTGNFHFLASAAHEYRSATWWPDEAGPVRVQGYRTLSTLIQVRIVNAEIFWNFRNLLGERYSQIPGYAQPRLTNMYGVRWHFWN